MIRIQIIYSKFLIQTKRLFRASKYFLPRNVDREQNIEDRKVRSVSLKADRSVKKETRILKGMLKRLSLSNYQRWIRSLKTKNILTCMYYESVVMKI